MKRPTLILLGLATIVLTEGLSCTGGVPPPALTISQYAYVANSNSSNVSAYGVGLGSGVLTQVAGSPFTTGSGPHGVVAFLNNLGIGQVYATNENSNTISAYAVNSATGAIAPVGSFAEAGGPYGVAVDSLGVFLYVTNFVANPGTVSAYTINSATGALTQVGLPVAAGSFPYGVAVDPTRKFLYVTNFGSANVSVYTINTAGGALTPVTGSPFAAGNSPTGVAVSGNGSTLASFLYVTNAGDNTVSAYITNDVPGVAPGVLGVVTGSPFKVGTAPFGVAVKHGSFNDFLYVTNSGDNTVSAYAIDSTTGALTQVGSPVKAGNSPTGVAVGSLGTFLYVTNAGDDTVSTYAINTATGALTPVGSPVAAGRAPNAVALLDTLGLIPPTPKPATQFGAFHGATMTTNVTPGATGLGTQLLTSCTTPSGPTCSGFIITLEWGANNATALFPVTTTAALDGPAGDITSPFTPWPGPGTGFLYLDILNSGSQNVTFNQTPTYFLDIPVSYPGTSCFEISYNGSSWQVISPSAVTPSGHNLSVPAYTPGPTLQAGVHYYVGFECQ